MAKCGGGFEYQGSGLETDVDLSVALSPHNESDLAPGCSAALALSVFRTRITALLSLLSALHGVAGWTQSPLKFPMIPKVHVSVW